MAFSLSHIFVIMNCRSLFASFAVHVNILLILHSFFPTNFVIYFGKFVCSLCSCLLCCAKSHCVAYRARCAAGAPSAQIGVICAHMRLLHSK